MNTLTIITKNHFTACFRMFLTVIPACPQSQWNTGNENTSIWKRVLHTLESVDYWFGNNSPCHFNNIFPEMSAEMDHENKRQLSKEEIAMYCTTVSEKIESFFRSLDDEKLSVQSDPSSQLTYLDIIFMQIRHIQNNTGYCSQQIKAATGCGIAWQGYCES